MQPHTHSHWFAFIYKKKKRKEKKANEKNKRTRTMRNNTLLFPTSLNPLLIPHKPLNSMKRAPDFKRPDPLQILTLEP